MSELLPASRIEGVEPNHALPCWLVVDRYPETLERIYQLEPSPQLTYLFQETKYASLDEYSPLVVRIERGSALWHAYSQQQDAAVKWLCISYRVISAVTIAHSFDRFTKLIERTVGC
ncbi:hypothetical protein HORIV_57840 [Vreelandella olivaria]|uniref:DUF4123 domain-containing protein n=1 Tax=Vreelandella olivaria TaxID=390919 RepID=A0ABM7GRN0_9GAMM|nr:hypothetical protein HORIV_57840 [Halomonas olivaria]